MRRPTTRDGRRVQFQADILTAWIDRAEAAAGPAPDYRVVPCNGGFELQRPALMATGRWEMQREAWSRDRKDMEQAARLRGWTLGG